jgi:phosphoribosyl 1,2-cyclic phosphodiesterase
VLNADHQEPIVFDLGTGVRFFGAEFERGAPFRASALVTHFHWGTVQGLPFFGRPCTRTGASTSTDPPDGRSLADIFDVLMRPPYFPVTVAELPGDIRFHDCDDSTFRIGKAEVMAREIPHLGRTFGYRVTVDGVSVAYMSDHQQPIDGSNRIADSVLELADGADLLIHDAQFTSDEFSLKRNWGHCTIEYAAWVAKEAGVRRLALFHHDPSRTDDDLDTLTDCVKKFGDRHGFDVFAAREGLQVELH